MNFDTTYVHLRDDLSAAPIEVTETFWRELTSDGRPDLDPGRLVMSFSFTEDWPTWERHPAGEELVTLLSGQATLVLQTTDGERTHHLKAPGDFALIPKGTWHTARTTTPCTMLFITPGRGTENRPR